MNTPSPNPNSPIHFAQTEEAFLLNCVGEVIKIWASKSGKDNMKISVENGMVELNHDF